MSTASPRRTASSSWARSISAWPARGPPPRRVDVQDCGGGDRSVAPEGPEAQDADDPAGIAGHEGLVARADVREDLAPGARAAREAVRVRRRRSRGRPPLPTRSGRARLRSASAGVGRSTTIGPPLGPIQARSSSLQAAIGVHGIRPLPIIRRVAAAFRRSRCQPGGTRSGARSARGARTNRRSRMDGMRNLEEAGGGAGVDGGRRPGSPRAAARWRCDRGRRAAGRGPARAGPHRPRRWRPNERSSSFRATSRSIAPVAGSAPAGTSSATTAFRKSGWSVHADGRRAVEARDAAEASAGQGAERGNGVGQRRAGVADVRPEPDVRPNLAASRPRIARLARPLQCRVSPWPSESCTRAGRRCGRADASARGTPDPRCASGSPSGSSSGRRGGLRRPGGPPDGRILRGAAARARRRARARVPGLVVLGSGSIPLATDARPRARCWQRPRPASVGRSRTTATPPMWSRSGPRRLSPPCRTCRATTPSRAGSRRPAVAVERPSPTDAGSALDLDSPARSRAAAAATPACPEPVAGLATARWRAPGARPGHSTSCGAGPRPPGGASVAASAVRGPSERKRTACRTRALVEERGLRARPCARPRPPPRRRSGCSSTSEGPEAIGRAPREPRRRGRRSTRRVLLAHRLGADEAGWPSAEDRYASDLLLADRVRDPGSGS